MTLTPPAPIRVGDSNAFALDTFQRRKPAIVQDILHRNPDYPAVIRRDLEALRDALAAGDAIAMIEPLAVDYDPWLAAYLAQQRLADPLTWHNVEWFFAETYLYRYLMQVVRYFETGRDPFKPTKHEELASPALWRALEIALNGRDDLAHLLACALWGNRVDLSYTPAASKGVEVVGADDLLADDRAAVLEYLRGVGEKTVHLIADNAGTELLMDLVLVDALLAHRARVVLHLKMHPTYVSDALPGDVWDTVAALEGRGGDAAALGGRLRAAWLAKQLVFAPHFYWNSSRFLWDMPSTLARVFQGAFLAILKGDANYRRSIGDAVWEPSTPFAAVADYFPAPLLALRTLKSDPLVGIAPGLAEKLSADGHAWRTNGQHGVIQFKGAG